MLLYNKSKGVVLAGLTRRRLAEVALFNKPTNVGTVINSIKKTNEEIAREVLEGKWGNGADRKNRLNQAGYNYSDIQAIVNKILRT